MLPGVRAFDVAITEMKMIATAVPRPVVTGRGVVLRIPAVSAWPDRLRARYQDVIGYRPANARRAISATMCLQIG
jgi:hypothetical protein